MTRRTLPTLMAIGFALAGLTPIVLPTPAEAKAAGLGPAPDFTLLRNADGKAFKLSSMKGKVRLIDFWATWCPPCRKEIPSFIALQKKYQAKGLEVIGVCIEQDANEKVNAFAKEYGINYTSVISSAEVEAAYGGIRSIPTTFLVDRQGHIVKKYIGETPMETFEADLKKLL
ncbi:MAG: TlpA disulfide reductase family protein [Candidatus Sericytochromatia bacterium]|nr:TlpA disulfide reductase family protein [Candidatus Sericytochromatia bacterium]